ENRKSKIPLLFATALALTFTPSLLAGRIETPIDPATLATPLYSVQDHALSRHNGPNYNNRPLYCNQLSAVLLAGDKPYFLLGSGKTILANLMLALSHNNNTTWLHNAANITATYLPGRYQYTIKDPAWGQTSLLLEITTAPNGAGLAAHLHIDNPNPNDQILLASGAAFTRGSVLNDWDMTIPTNRQKLSRGFTPSDCKNNLIQIQSPTSWTLQAKESAPTTCATLSATNTQLTITDATTYATPEPPQGTRSVSAGHTTAPSTGSTPAHAANDAQSPNPPFENRNSKIENPLLIASFPANENPDTYFTLQESPNRIPSVSEGSTPAPTPGTPPAHAATQPLGQSELKIQNRKSKIENPPTPKSTFEAGIHRVQQIENSIQVNTPDPWLNAAIADSTTATDGVFRNGVFTHAGMKWGVPLLGWRVLYGGTVYGAHDRILTEAKAAIAKQITSSDKLTPHPDPKTLLSSQAPDSRFFGKGRIDFHQPYHYDMQSQFFEQLQHAWRATANPELESLLAKSLPLHCQYLQECFDPQKLGIYESYCNTWPTDDQWYNGGGTAEETAYAYRAECTALQLAQRAHDEQAIAFHQANVDRIKSAFFKLLWNDQTGHPGAYREQGGLKRLHDSCWRYSIFCPIDANLLSPEQAASSLYYTESQLQRVKLPYGGQQCWPSNWVPSLWSVREMWPGDNYQLALAYFQTGLPDDGYALLRGTFPQHMLFGTVPGDLGAPAGGTDFNDCLATFDRTVVEGLFGYTPDYTNNLVTFRPNFPTTWNHASIKTPDFSLTFSQQNNTSKYQFSITHPAPLHLELPVSTSAIDDVLVNNAPAKFETLPAFGRTLITLDLPESPAATIEIHTHDSLPSEPSLQLTANVGDWIPLAAEYQFIDAHDPEHVLTQLSTRDRLRGGTLSDTAGDRILFILKKPTGSQLPQWQQIKVHVTDKQKDAALAGKFNLTPSPNATFEQLPLANFFNADIRNIYKQKYLDPRPNTCSLRLASDGYGTWQMVLQKNYHAPEITLTPPATAPAATPTQTPTQTPRPPAQTPPFAVQTGTKNVLFTSLWDNFPHRIQVPINKSADAIAFLIAGTTNPMEVRIPNARITITYDDNSSDHIDLIPPFNFWTLGPIDGIDYDYNRDAFALPKTPPQTIQLGKNCRANVLTYRLKKNATIKTITLETLSQQAVVGLMGITLIHDQKP
ncbi:MAG: DUF4450 domain-containing protein, partial [Phycisphaerae bacterium]